MKYFILDENKNPIEATILEYGEWCQKNDKRIAKTKIGNITVSTVFLFINHNHDEAATPLLFETMIFNDGAGSDRYLTSTWQEAEDTHQRTVEQIRQLQEPRGLGYAAIVTSDIFGIASTLDQPTYLLLERQRAYAGKEHLSHEELEDLSDINSKLERLGFRFFHPDEEYARYLRLRSEAMRARFGSDDPEELARRSIAMNPEEREELGKQLIRELLAEQRDGSSNDPRAKLIKNT